jgi:hypothetical protein
MSDIEGETTKVGASARWAVDFGTPAAAGKLQGGAERGFKSDEFRGQMFATANGASWAAAT